MKSWSLLLLLLASGCADEVTNPAPRPPGAPAPESAPPSFAAAKRTVETRVPWGGPPGNLLVDGDFEHSIGFEGSSQQTGWVAFGNALVGMRGETGGQCKSGLQCALLRPEMLLFGKGVAAKDVSMTASIWAKPPAGRDCAVVQPYVVGCSLEGDGDDLTPETLAPGADGWCVYRAQISAQREGVCMIVESTLAEEETALVDAATVLPNDGTAPGLPGSASMEPLPGGVAARARTLGEHLRRSRRFGASPPSPLDRVGPR